MKRNHFIHLLAVLGLLLTVAETKAQKNINRDIFAVKIAVRERIIYGLSDAAFGQVLAAEKTRALQLDSLDTNKQLSAGQRVITLKAIRQQYEGQISQALSASQWQQFVQRQAAAKDSVNARMKGKKIPIKELGQ